MQTATPDIWEVNSHLVFWMRYPSIPMMNVINQLKAWSEWKPSEDWCRTNICVLEEFNYVLWKE